MSINNIHDIEQSVKVYLELNEDGTAWVLDHTSADGYALDSDYDGGAINDQCDCGDPDACEAMKRQANELPLPHADDLLKILADYLGYTLTKETA